MARVKSALAIVAASAIGVLMTACGSGGTVTTPPPTTYTLTVDSTNPSSGVSITGTAGTTPYTETGSSGTQYTLTAPATAGGNNFSSWTGCTSTSGVNCSVTLSSNTTVTANYATPAAVTPAVTVTPASSSITTAQSLSVTIAVAGPSGSATPTGSVTLTSGSYTSSAATLSSGSATIIIPAGSLATATDTLTATYTPDSSSSSVYTTATGTATVTVTAPVPTYTLTIDSTNPASGVTIGTSVQGSDTITPETTPYTFTLDAGTTMVLTAPSTAGSNTFASWTGCTSATTETCIVTVNANTIVTANYTAPITYTLTVDSTNPPSGVTITASPADVNSKSSGTTALVLTYDSGTAVTLTAPATASGNTFSSWTGCASTSGTGGTVCSVTVSANATVTANYVSPTTVSINQSSVGAAVTDQILGVNLEAWYDVDANASTVAGPMQTAGLQSLRWPGGSWSDAYHWTGANQYISGDASTQPYMCDTGSNNTTENEFNWAGNTDDAFSDFESDIAMAGTGFDLALTANYGSNEACNGGGDPNEAAAWAAAAVTDGHPASHITIGNEVYGDWEYDLHSVKHDPTTYADAVIGTNGYYDSIKNAVTNAGGNSNDTLVGVVVDANCTTSSGCTDGWDTTVLSTAKGYYDFVEYHYYPEYSDGYDSQLIGTGSPSYVQQFTTNINTIKQELTTAGEPNTPIYVGEISSNSANAGTQNWSITQALYAGEILGEAMNDGVSRLTWWDGFGNCQGSSGLPPNNSTLYGWQDWGNQSIFSAGSSTDSGCPGDGTAGTLSPTAVAFQLFSNVAVNGENVLTATVSGGATTYVKAYAATHSGGTALVLFNLNATTAEPVQITLSSETSTTDMKMLTYDKEMYDYTNVNCEADSVSTFTPYPCTYDSTHNYSTADWVQQPTTTDLGAQSLPYTLTLQPWSMNVVIIK